MATVLQNYTQRKAVLEQKQANGGLTEDEILAYQELLYRISVLGSFQMFGLSAPITTSGRALSYHFQLVDAYLYSMSQEHRFGQPSVDDARARRQTAYTSFTGVLQNCRRQFGSFRPEDERSYKIQFDRMIQTVLPAWLQ